MDIYLETSALNYFRGTLSNDDALATRDVQQERGRRWVLSPITVWEVLLTRDAERKESLISLAQHLLDKEMLPTPEELLLKYIEQGCPLEEKPRPLISGSALAATWRDLHAVPDKTFIYDELQFRMKARALAGVMQDLHRLLRDREVSIAPYAKHAKYDVTLEYMVNQLPFVKKEGELNPEYRARYKVALFYILFLLCAGIGIDPEAVGQFWKARKIRHPGERMLYMISEHETLVYRGPIAQMARMTLVQAAGPYSRGLFWDCLHAFYLTYISVMFAEDAHFAALRANLKDHPNGEKILKPSELPWASEKRSIERKSFFAT